MAAPPPLVVLVHGAFHGAWCWAGLQAELDQLAVPSLAVDLKQPSTRALWQSVPSTYIRCLDDQAVPIAAQDQLAARCGTTLTIDADHSPFLGCPAELAVLLAGVVRTV